MDYSRSLAVGFTLGLAYKHNFLGIRDIANELGDNLNKSISDVSKAFDSGIKSVKICDLLNFIKL